MRKIICFIIPLLLIGCKTDRENKLEDCQLITDIFDKSEIKDLTKIFDFFNEQINVQHKVNRTESYKMFCERMKESEIKGFFDINIPFQKQMDLYSQISENTFQQIWIFTEGKIRRQGSFHPSKSISLNFNGKYSAFLKELGKENSAIYQYYENFEVLKDISPNMAAFMMNYDIFDINDIRVHLVFAIHYLTLNDVEKRDKIVTVSNSPDGVQ